MSRNFKLFCVQCKMTTIHKPVRVFLAEKDKRDIIVNEKTSKPAIMLQCVECGKLEKNFKRGMYSFHHEYNIEKLKMPNDLLELKL